LPGYLRLRQVTAVSFAASEAAAIVVKAVSEIVEATKVINGDLESYVRFVVSGSAPMRRQPMPVTLVEMSGPANKPEAAGCGATSSRTAAVQTSSPQIASTAA
jgi:hypothetical protein